MNSLRPFVKQAGRIAGSGPIVYGFMAADADQYRTLVFQDHAPIGPGKDKKDYRNSAELADKSIK